MLKNFLSRIFKSDLGARPQIPKPLIPAEGQVLDQPRSFGFKCNWLTVRTTDTDRLAAVFRLTSDVPCNWEYGIPYAYEKLFFVSPPVDGWSFIISRSLPCAEDGQTISVLKDLLIGLSREFGEAQYFGTYRVVSYDCWMKAVDGQMQRAYGYADGSNTIVEGEPTPVERKYDLINTFSEEANIDPEFYEKAEHPDESMTMEIAEAWGISPEYLDERKEIASRLGLLGVRNW
jgi:hypothetical protein